MATDRSVSTSIAIATIIGLGGLAYWFFSRRKEITGQVIAVSQLSDDDTFMIYPLTNDVNFVKDYIDDYMEDNTTAIDRNKSKLKYLRVSQVDQKDDMVRLVGMGKMNGKYKIYKRNYLSTDPTKKRMVALTLKNNGKWDGETPKGSVEKGSKKLFWFDEGRPPRVILKAKK